MTKTQRVLSILIAVIMVVSMASSLTTAFAADASSGTDSLDSFIYGTIRAKNNLGYGAAVPSGIMFVLEACASKEDGEWIYFEYTETGKTYKAQKGVNMFASIQDVLAVASRDNLVIKVGPGVYQADGDITLSNSGLKFYGNYAGVNPNEMNPDDPYDMVLSGKRNDDTLESVLSGIKFQWTIKSHNITFDGFKLTKDASFMIGVSGKTNIMENAYIYNNIMTGSTGGQYRYFVYANIGTKYGITVQYNRLVGNNCTVMLIGGGALDVRFEYNYIANHTGKLFWITSCGAYGVDNVISYSHNIVKSSNGGLHLLYSNADYGTNLFYQRLVGNIFNSCGGSQPIIVAQYLPDNGTIPIIDSASKTLISGNTFYKIPSTSSAVSLIGGVSTLGITVNYLVTVTNNKFLFTETQYSSAINASIMGTVDATKNYYGDMNGNCVGLAGMMVSASSTTKLIKMPYYLDEEMTTLSGAIELQKAEDNVISGGGFDAESFAIDNKTARISAYAAAGRGDVDFSNTIIANNVTIEIYRDFLLTSKVLDNVVDITDDVTRAYLIATDNTTGQATKYDVVILAETDKKKADLKYIRNETVHDRHTNVSVDKKTWNVILDESQVFFPFELVVSPSATYKLYTDIICKNEYTDASFYMKPDQATTLYAKITSGDGTVSSIYTLNFSRQGTAEYDARILSILNPTQNIRVFNNERKSIVYRPYGLTRTENFEFEVSRNASYRIYKDYDKETDTVSNPVVINEDGTVDLPDGLSFYYVEVSSEFGYKTVYTLSMYNDIKSSDNEITDITSLEGVTVDKDLITIIVTSPTLMQVNAHFETNPFADVQVYADEAKTYKLTPNISSIMINNREVEERTFALGISSQFSKFFVVVTAETGDIREYTVHVKRGEGAKEFTDIGGHWATEYINEATRIGIIGGYQDSETGEYTFRPNKNATRQEVAAMLLRSMGIDPLSFKAVALGSILNDADDIPDWSYNYVRAVYALGIMKGGSDGNFRASAPITRQEFFQAIANMTNLDIEGASDYDLSVFSDAADVAPWAVPAVKAVVKAGIVGGSNGKLNPKSNITRAEIAKILSITNTISNDVK